MSHPVRPWGLALVLLGLVAADLSAGGTRADYERADTLARTVRGKVLNEALDLVWVGPEEAVYRRQTASGTWRWMRLDAATGERVEAFDHTKVAAALTERGDEAEADRLGLLFLESEGDRLRVLAAKGAFSIDPATSAVEAIDAESIGALRLPVVKADRSQGGGEDTAILFINVSAGPVRLLWLDHDGQPKAYGWLEPGASKRQHTYPGHVWRAESEDGGVRGTWRARKRLGVALIEAAASDAEPRTPTARRRRGTSPDGRWRIFVRDHDAWLEDLEKGGERRLTDDGTAEDAYVGRWSWSPSSQTVMVVREAPAEERRVQVVDSAPDDRLQPRVRSWRYLKPGDRIARPRPHLFDATTGRRIDLPESDFATPWSIDRFSWAPDGERFRFLYNQRGHQVLRFLELDAEAASVRTILEERSDTFVDYSQKTYLERISGTDDWLWMSERSGWNHLYRLEAAAGSLSPLTKGSWVVRRVVDLDARAGTVLFAAMGVHPDQDPYHVHYGRVGLDGEGLVWLTEGDGTHEIEFSKGGAHYVDTWSRVDHPPVHELRRTADGALVAVIEEADWSALLEAGWRPPERFVAKGRDGTTDIWGVVHTPSTFDAGERYPVVEAIYAGPHDHFVAKRFRAWHGAQGTAELGFVVVRIDGMGTNWRSKAFHDVCWKNLADAGFPDRVRWLRAAAEDRPWMDLSRVGIYGGSAGGQSAMRALLAHADTYHVAVADCGCHDNRMDKIWWNEAWMGWPVGPHYAEQSNVTQAHRLRGKLLLVVGEVDRNVDPASTMQVVDALVRADKDFDLVVIPGQGHGAADTPYGRRRLRDFLVRHLLGVEPRGR